jgi:acid phosphatase (class B)
MNPVIFAGDKPGQNTKTQWLQAKQIKVFYGDSDNDITAAREAGARGSACCVPPTPPISRCRWPARWAKK